MYKRMDFLIETMHFQMPYFNPLFAIIKELMDNPNKKSVDLLPNLAINQVYRGLLFSFYHATVALFFFFKLKSAIRTGQNLVS